MRADRERHQIRSTDAEYRQDADERGFGTMKEVPGSTRHACRPANDGVGSRMARGLANDEERENCNGGPKQNSRDDRQPRHKGMQHALSSLKKSGSDNAVLRAFSWDFCLSTRFLHKKKSPARHESVGLKVKSDC